MYSASKVSFSQDFLAWYQLAQAYRDAYNGPLGDDVDDMIAAAMQPLEERIYAQDVRGIEDACVVAEIGMVALFWSEQEGATETFDPFERGLDGDLTSSCRDERSRAVLIQAAAKMFMGGANA